MSKAETPTIMVSEYEQVWLDGLNRGDFSVAGQAFLPDCVVHINGSPEKNLSVEGFQQLVAGLFIAFPDLHFTIKDHFLSGASAATRWKAEGTHTGPLGATSATGKRVSIDGLIIDHLINGKVAERWELWDQMGMLQDLGLV